MGENFLTLFNSLINTEMLSRIRRNHGLEHATLNILAEKKPSSGFAGLSDAGGFWILGNIGTQDLALSVEEALSRLQKGERALAIHPNCGTNIATSGVLAGLAASLTMLGGGRRMRDKLDRLPLAITLSTLALVFAQPLGLKLQQNVTTSGSPQGLKIVDIIYTKRGRATAHRIVTTG